MRCDYFNCNFMKIASDQPDDRLIDAVEALSAEVGMADHPSAGRGFTAEELRLIAAMRRQRALLRGVGERVQRAAGTAEALERLSLASELQAIISIDPAELVPQALPISAFRVERRPVWQRVVASGWPTRFAAAACVGLVGYLGVIGFSAAQGRYIAWQHEQTARLAQAAEAGSAGGSRTELNLARPKTVDAAAVATRTEFATDVPPELIAGVPPLMVATVTPATSSELARLGQLVILVRAKSAGQVNSSISGLAKRASEVIAVSSAEAGWQSEVIASVTTALAESPSGGAMAGLMPQPNLGQPTLISYGPMAQSAVPTMATAKGFNGSGDRQSDRSSSSNSRETASAEDVRSRLTDWFSSRPATTHLLSLRDQPEAIERLMRRLKGSRGVTVEVVRLTAPLSEARLSTGQTAVAVPAAKAGANPANPTIPDNLLWWTKPATQWQRLEIPVIVVEQ